MIITMSLSSEVDIFGAAAHFHEQTEPAAQIAINAVT
jgi:hypothetical protein